MRALGARSGPPKKSSSAVRSGLLVAAPSRPSKPTISRGSFALAAWERRASWARDLARSRRARFTAEGATRAARWREERKGASPGRRDDGVREGLLACPHSREQDITNGSAATSGTAARRDRHAARAPAPTARNRTDHAVATSLRGFTTHSETHCPTVSPSSGLPRELCSPLATRDESDACAARGSSERASCCRMMAMRAHLAPALLAGVILGCAPSKSARRELCEFGEFPIPSVGDGRESPASWRPRRVEAVVQHRDELHRRPVVVTGYYQHGFELFHLWPSKAAAERGGLDRPDAPVIRMYQAGGSEQHLRYCKNSDLVVYGEFISRLEFGVNYIIPKAIRVGRAASE